VSELYGLGASEILHGHNQEESFRYISIAGLNTVICFSKLGGDSWNKSDSAWHICALSFSSSTALKEWSRYHNDLGECLRDCVGSNP